MFNKRLEKIVDKLEELAGRLENVKERLEEIKERTGTAKERLEELERKYPILKDEWRPPPSYEPPHKWWGEPGIPSFPGPSVPGIPSFPDQPCRCVPDHPCKPGIPCHYLDVRQNELLTHVCKKCGKMQ